MCGADSRSPKDDGQLASDRQYNPPNYLQGPEPFLNDFNAGARSASRTDLKHHRAASSARDRDGPDGPGAGVAGVISQVWAKEGQSWRGLPRNNIRSWRLPPTYICVLLITQGYS